MPSWVLEWRVRNLVAVDRAFIVVVRGGGGCVVINNYIMIVAACADSIMFMLCLMAATCNKTKMAIGSFFCFPSTGGILR